MVEFGDNVEANSADPNELAHMAGIAAVRSAGFDVEVVNGLLRLPAVNPTEAMIAYNRARIAILNDTEH